MMVLLKIVTKINKAVLQIEKAKRPGSCKSNPVFSYLMFEVK
ncbi:Cyclic lactone autoinducer peptide [Filibacter tadaridae]|uniref:Uncharacterized protein n=1 Tax=Filibacter tadaridae TaxID=2483811 RepID=A0A3P5X5C0_9BACL|nr:hypothetical protein FILTAD_02075 [Filibacter tadaridae]